MGWPLWAWPCLLDQSIGRLASQSGARLYCHFLSGFNYTAKYIAAMQCTPIKSPMKPCLLTSTLRLAALAASRPAYSLCTSQVSNTLGNMVMIAVRARGHRGCLNDLGWWKCHPALLQKNILRGHSSIRIVSMTRSASSQENDAQLCKE